MFDSLMIRLSTRKLSEMLSVPLRLRRIEDEGTTPLFLHPSTVRVEIGGEMCLDRVRNDSFVSPSVSPS